MLRPVLAIKQAFQSRDEIIRHGATDAAVGKLDNVVFLAAFDAAALQDLAINADVAELIDDNGKPPSIRVFQNMPQQCRLSSTEEAGEDRARDLF